MDASQARWQVSRPIWADIIVPPLSLRLDVGGAGSVGHRERVSPASSGWLGPRRAGRRVASDRMVRSGAGSGRGTSSPAPRLPPACDLTAGPLGTQARCPGRILAGDGGQQRPRVGVVGFVEELVDGALLHDLAQVHDRDPVGRVVHHGQVVGDEQVGQAVLLLEVLEQVDDLRLHGDVQRGDRLVEHQQLRLHRQRPGDADALPLPAGELVRVARACSAPRPTSASSAATRSRRSLAGAADAVDGEHLGEGVGHGHARVERRVGVLEDDLDALPQPAQLAGRRRQHVDAVEGDAPAVPARGAGWPAPSSSCRCRTRPRAPASGHGAIEKLTPRTRPRCGPAGRSGGRAMPPATREGDVQVLDLQERRGSRRAADAGLAAVGAADAHPARRPGSAGERATPRQLRGSWRSRRRREWPAARVGARPCSARARKSASTAM